MPRKWKRGVRKQFAMPPPMNDLERQILESKLAGERAEVRRIYAAGKK
jgi:hypothetical protein